MSDRTNKKAFKEIEALYKQKNFVKKEITEWILILKIIFVLVSMIGLGWFIKQIALMTLEAGG